MTDDTTRTDEPTDGSTTDGSSADSSSTDGSTTGDSGDDADPTNDDRPGADGSLRPLADRFAGRVVPLEGTDVDRLAAYFGTERSGRSPGAVYDPDDERGRLHDSYRLPGAFDALVVVAGTSRARPIARE